MPTAYSVPFVVILDATVAVVRVASAAEEVKSDQWGGVRVAACVHRAVFALSRRVGGGRGAGRGGGSDAVCREGRCASCRLRAARSWRFFAALLSLTWSWTLWRGRCGFFVRDILQYAAFARRAAGDYWRRGGGERGAGRGNEGGADFRTGRCASCAMRAA